jgi:hypothetical protein
MEELGGYRELSDQARVAGAAIFAVAVVLVGFLERLQAQLKAAESSKWWASNGRDVVNAVAFGMMVAALRAIGFAGPISLAISATLVIVLSLVQSSLVDHPRLSTLVTAAVSLAVGLPVLVIPRAVHAVFRRTLEALF